MDLLEKGLSASNFAMLGLGDIVIPGELYDFFEAMSMKLSLCMLLWDPEHWTVDHCAILKNNI